MKQIKPRKRETKSALKELWKAEYSIRADGICVPYACVLCAESGVIDTRDSAILPDGRPIGKLVYCMCEIGRYKQKVDAHGFEEHHPLARYGAKVGSKK